jgi:uncharacterized protein (TIGR03085 family)
MTSMAQTERVALCDLALQLGPDRPTLCEGWAVRDLVAHLLVREGSPAAVGITVPRLAGVTDRAMTRKARRDYAVLVERLRSGPPVWSPFRIGKVDKLLNTLEYFVHHEDIRRAQPDWAPRTLAPRAEKLLWHQLAVAGKRLLADAPVGVRLERSDTAETITAKPGEPSVMVRGLPPELVLFVFGRRGHAQVEVSGDEAAVTALTRTDLSI